MKFKNLNILVYGMSVSGEWASKLLVKLRANVFLFDDNKETLKKKPIKNCYVLNSLNENLLEQFDLIIVSPSITLENEFLILANKKKIRVMSEIEFAAMFCDKLIAITGTNGKTTTTELVAEILKNKYKTVACGNIGYPLSRAVIEKKRYIKVVEVSSFMLEHADTFSPHASTILNITPDHLVRHKTMEEYKKYKLSIFKNLKPIDYVVVNLDDEIFPKRDCLKVTYSTRHIADVYLRDGYIFLHHHKIVGINELTIKGKHNLQNVMCAICFAYIYKIPPQDIRKTLVNYVPEHFRIEKVGEFKGIKFVNDSKSTNIASTLASVETVRGAIILLLGGSNKMLDYSLLFAKLSKRVKLVICYGEIADELLQANAEKFACVKCSNLKEAFDVATTHALSADTILLSPASASYDEFKNYIERGKFFDELVADYESKITNE